MENKEQLGGFTIKGTETELLGSVAMAVAAIYAQVFAGEPWNEVSKCPSCGKFSAAKVGESCTNSECLEKPQLVEAYPLPETAAYVRSEVEKPGGILETLVLQDKWPEIQPVGFASGY